MDCATLGEAVSSVQKEDFLRSPQTDRGGRHKPRTREERKEVRLPAHGCGMFMKKHTRDPEEVRTGEPRE